MRSLVGALQLRCWVAEVAEVAVARAELRPSVVERGARREACALACVDMSEASTAGPMPLAMTTSARRGRQPARAAACPCDDAAEAGASIGGVIRSHVVRSGWPFARDVPPRPGLVRHAAGVTVPGCSEDYVARPGARRPAAPRAARGPGLGFPAVEAEDGRAIVGRYWDGLWRHRDLSVVD